MVSGGIGLLKQVWLKHYRLLPCPRPNVNPEGVEERQAMGWGRGSGWLAGKSCVRCTGFSTRCNKRRRDDSCSLSRERDNLRLTYRQDSCSSRSTRPYQLLHIRQKKQVSSWSSTSRLVLPPFLPPFLLSVQPVDPLAGRTKHTVVSPEVKSLKVLVVLDMA